MCPTEHSGRGRPTQVGPFRMYRLVVLHLTRSTPEPVQRRRICRTCATSGMPKFAALSRGRIGARRIQTNAHPQAGPTTSPARQDCYLCGLSRRVTGFPLPSLLTRHCQQCRSVNWRMTMHPMRHPNERPRGRLSVGLHDSSAIRLERTVSWRHEPQYFRWTNPAFAVHRCRRCGNDRGWDPPPRAVTDRAPTCRPCQEPNG